MKRTCRTLAFSFMCLAVLSCQKAPPTAAPSQALLADEKSGFMIRSGMGLYAIADGTAKWASEPLLLGEKLALTGQASKATLDGKERDFIEVKRDSGKAGWAWPEYLVSNALLAVVGNDDAIVYTEPKNTAATARSIPKMSVLVVHAETNGQPYLKVTSYNPGAFLKGVYVRSEGISTKPDDVQSVILLQLAAAAKDPKQKQALLTSAAKDYPGSAFITQVEDAIAALTAPTDIRATEKFFATMISIADKVNVRDAPDETTGKSIGQLSMGQKVEVEEQTTESYTVNGQTAPWYKVNEPAGWVFGALLGPEE